MKLANLDGRATLIGGNVGVDLHTVSHGRFGPELQPLYEQWDELLEFTSGLGDLAAVTSGVVDLDESKLRSPVPFPRQVFAIGINYKAHASEMGRELPKMPATFTKFPSCLAGPFDDVVIAGETVDWEVELVAVIGRRADNVAEADAWDHIAGLTVGQDISERTVQMEAGGQFSLGKSFRGFGPMGPWLVTADEVPDRDDLGLRCSIDGVEVQNSRTSDMIFDIPSLISQLSVVLSLLPGDVIFTGTPSGVGMGRKPPRFLAAGETLESEIEGIGKIRNRFV